jgi:quinol monooxygenase YgiN
MSDMPLAPFALMVSYRVNDFEAWKTVFEDHEEARAQAGFLGHHVNRGEHDPNLLSLYFAIGDIAKAKAYAASDDLKAAMQAATATGEPEIHWMVPESEDIVWDREVPAVVISHLVENFGTWFEGYKSAEADAMRQAAGVIGHAVNRSPENPNLAVIYHQAETFDDLHALASSDDLRHVMKDAGVVSEPEFSYYTGMMGRMY